MVVVVEHADAPGQRLNVQTDYDHPDAGAQARTISPGTVRTIVLTALALGWDPEKRGTPLQFRMEEERLIPR